MLTTSTEALVVNGTEVISIKFLWLLYVVIVAQLPDSSTAIYFPTICLKNSILSDGMTRVGRSQQEKKDRVMARANTKLMQLRSPRSLSHGESTRRKASLLPTFYYHGVARLGNSHPIQSALRGVLRSYTTVRQARRTSPASTSPPVMPKWTN